LRVWYCGGWSEDLPSIINWLNQHTGKFEKSHEGVYIQIQPVESSAMAGICENGIIPPDIILFPPGVFESPDCLIPLEDNLSIRSNLSAAGNYNGITYALPILMSGYAWAYNTDLLDSIPNTWEKRGALAACLPDNNFNYWSAAVAGLCSETCFHDDEDIHSAPSSFDLDLGLDISEETPVPIQTPVPSSDELLYCRLPSSFSIYAEAWADFLAGKVAAIPVAARQIRYLKNLSNQGKGPEWKIIATGDIAFTDQILFAGIVDKSSDCNKTSLCRSFIQYLLSEEIQRTLSSAGVFSVTDTLSCLPGHDPEAVIENALYTKKLCTVPVFMNSSDGTLNSIVRDFFQSRGFNHDLYRRFLDLSQ
jgi:ABC-type glycerol-3-phosphate transport system substrate-binding protein